MGIPDMRTCKADTTIRASDTRDIILDGAIGCDNYSRSMAIEYDPMTDHYVALGVGSMASHDEIKKAHRALIRELHPDCGGDAVPAAQVNIARDVLLDPVTREEYDRARREWHEQRPLTSIFTEPGLQIHRERAQARTGASAAANTARRTRQNSSARAEGSASRAEAAQPGSFTTHANNPSDAAAAQAQQAQGERPRSDPTDWQPYLAKALLAGRFFRDAQNSRSFAAGVAIGAAGLLDNIIKNRVGDNPELRECVDMLSHAIWIEHVRVFKATTEQRTGRRWDPVTRRRVVRKRKKTRDGSSKTPRTGNSDRTAPAPRRRSRNQASGRR
jgi:curved DNA-binding protein CbpA